MRLLPLLLLAFSTAAAQSAAPIAASTPAPASSTAPAPDAKPALPTIFVCGDSTANNNNKDRQGKQMMGWGTAIAPYFDPAKVTISNVAHAGTSSMTYFNGDWPKVLPKIKKDDYVLEVFGINDGGLHTPNGLGDEVNDQGQHTYGWYMSKMATDAQEKGAHVILLTLTVRNVWTNPLVKFTDATPTGPLPENYDPKQDKIVRGDKYAGWTLDVGAKLHLPVLDLNNLEGDVYEKMGREKVMVNYSDHNHTFPVGADIVANIIVSGLKAFKNSPFTPMLSEKGKAVETAAAKYVIENSAPASDAAPAKPATSAAPATK